MRMDLLKFTNALCIPVHSQCTAVHYYKWLYALITLDDPSIYVHEA